MAWWSSADHAQYGLTNGIVRTFLNSNLPIILLILSLGRGLSLKEAILESCVVRLRPILLTAGVAMLSALPIATDPIFSGLAWALIFGLLASTAFTLLVVPVVYYLLYANRPGHGMPQTVG